MTIIGGVRVTVAEGLYILFLAGESRFEPSFLRGRIKACRLFAETELPKVAVWIAPILAGSDIVLTMPEDEF